ncbi:MAG: pyridoxal-dependent decarboxylase [Bryobacteraceae bacterium]
MSLLLDPDQRQKLWLRVGEIIERYACHVGELPVSPVLDPDAVRALLAPFDFETPCPPVEMVDWVETHLSRFQVHPPHPRYYGLYNPAPAAMGIAGDALAAAFNPNLAAWSHSPLAVEIELHLIRAFAARFGYSPSEAAGSFCSGGAEANHTALAVALTRAFPQFPGDGARALDGDPVFYASAECHHSFLKAAGLSGIGRRALRPIPVDGSLRMIPAALEAAVAEDRAAGRIPFMAIGTAGTTNAGAIDPLPEIAALCVRERLWFHVDAAWGGAAAFSRSLRPLLQGIERADSITFDAHKWMSVPMGAGVYITRHPEHLTRAFRTPTAYMPKEAAGLDVSDLHLLSMQWSRRFTGLKVFLSLAAAGWDGYEETVDRMAAIGDLLRRELRRAGWNILNHTPLPIVCFDGGGSVDSIARAVVASGEAWISTTVLAGSTRALRACITNYRTDDQDVRALIASLDTARRASS